MTRIPSRYQILLVGDPRLRLVSDPVSEEQFGASTTLAVERLAIAMRMSRYALGVCAPQLGSNRRIFVWDIPDEGSGHIINPTIEEADGSIVTHEGCLSIPDFYFEIERPASLLVKGQNVSGDEISYTAESLFARLVLHEMDHLNGVLMLDRLNDDQWNDFVEQWNSVQATRCSPDWRQELGAGA